MSTFVSAGQQDDGLRALFLVIHAVSGIVVYPKLRNPFSYGSDTSGVSPSQTLNSNKDTGPGADISQTIQPTGVDFHLTDIRHIKM